MNDPLSGIRSKVERAHRQLRELRTEVKQFLDRQPYGLTIDLDDQTRQMTARTVIRESCPQMWSVQIGEIAHNLRSALDHLVWQLVILETGQPPTTNKTQFPIFNSEPEYKRSERKFLHGTNAATRSLIEAQQPFHTGEKHSSPLWHLHELSNFDKHRTIHLTCGSLEQLKLDVGPLAAGQIGGEHVEVRGPGPFRDGTVFLKMHIRNWFCVPTHEVEVKGKFLATVVFDEGGPLFGGDLMPTLGAISLRTQQIIERIARDCFKVKFTLSS